MAAPTLPLFASVLGSKEVLLSFHAYHLIFVEVYYCVCFSIVVLVLLGRWLGSWLVGCFFSKRDLEIDGYIDAHDGAYTDDNN